MATRYAMGGTTIESRPKKNSSRILGENQTIRNFSKCEEKAYRGQGK